MLTCFSAVPISVPLETCCPSRPRPQLLGKEPKAVYQLTWQNLRLAGGFQTWNTDRHQHRTALFIEKGPHGRPKASKKKREKTIGNKNDAHFTATLQLTIKQKVRIIIQQVKSTFFDVVATVLFPFFLFSNGRRKAAKEKNIQIYKSLA